VVIPFLLRQSKQAFELKNGSDLWARFLGQPPGGPGQGEPRITGPMMAQYLLALLGNRDPMSALLAASLGGPGVPEQGQMGDYVFNQEGNKSYNYSQLSQLNSFLALDQIITQIMDNSNAHRPVPATEEIMAKLPREVLTVGCKC
jgi:E3 ubiquitin-protein ligase RNF115/126